MNVIARDDKKRKCSKSIYTLVTVPEDKVSSSFLLQSTLINIHNRY